MSSHLPYYETKPDKDLACTKCRCVLNDPVIDNCGHYYCASCLLNQRKKVGSCVISSQPLTHYTRPDSTFIDRIKALKVLCHRCRKNYVAISVQYLPCPSCVEEEEMRKKSWKPPKPKYPPPVTDIKLNDAQLILLENHSTQDLSSMDVLIDFLNFAGLLHISSDPIAFLEEKEVSLFLEHYDKVKKESQSSIETSTEASSSRQGSAFTIPEFILTSETFDKSMKQRSSKVLIYESSSSRLCNPLLPEKELPDKLTEDKQSSEEPSAEAISSSQPDTEITAIARSMKEIDLE